MTTILVFLAFAAVEYGLGFAVAQCLRNEAELGAYRRGQRQGLQDAIEALESAVFVELADGQGRFTTRHERASLAANVAVELNHKLWRM